jgi:hypothetical protein
MFHWKQLLLPVRRIRAAQLQAAQGLWGLFVAAPLCCTLALVLAVVAGWGLGAAAKYLQAHYHYGGAAVLALLGLVLVVSGRLQQRLFARALLLAARPKLKAVPTRSGWLRVWRW